MTTYNTTTTERLSANIMITDPMARKINHYVGDCTRTSNRQRPTATTDFKVLISFNNDDEPQEYAASIVAVSRSEEASYYLFYSVAICSVEIDGSDYLFYVYSTSQYIGEFNARGLLVRQVLIEDIVGIEPSTLFEQLELFDDDTDE